MAQLNYNNPGSLNPYGSFEPQGFLSGMMFPDKVRDYRTMTDLSNQAGSLANQRSAAELEDYRLGGDLRQMQRIRDTGALRNEVALQPDQHKLATMNLQGDMDVAQWQQANKVKLYQAVSQLDEQKKAAATADLGRAAAIMRGFRDDNYNPEIALRLLQQGGVDTSRWAGKDPSIVRQELDSIKLFDPAEFKHFSDMNQAFFNQTQQTGRHLEELETRRDIAAMTSGRTSAAGQKVQRDNEMDAEAERILEKYYSGKELSPAEKAKLSVWQTRTRDPFFAQGAKAQGEGDAVQQALGALRPSQNTPPPKTLPPVDNKDAEDIQKRFLEDKKMGEYRLGPYDPEMKRFPVYNGDTQIGWYN